MFKQETYTNALSSLIHNHPKLATTRCPSVTEWIKKRWLIADGIFLGSKEGWSVDRHHSMDCLKYIMLSETS